ncbi:MAG: hypothetical protein CM15mP48_2950 [Candidatus Poseidoniales archaeon]|nr:MAG: hypothetical protein CM15mP48_2950 [Candidatus Poseidoniales archaeon]
MVCSVEFDVHPKRRDGGMIDLDVIFIHHKHAQGA